MNLHARSFLLRQKKPQFVAVMAPIPIVPFGGGGPHRDQKDCRCAQVFLHIEGEHTAPSRETPGPIGPDLSMCGSGQEQ